MEYTQKDTQRLESDELSLYTERKNRVILT